MTATVGAIAPEQRRHRADIDGLRAVSILLVVAFHAGWSRFAGGYVGVDVFFVLSGFLITGLLVREQAQTGQIRLGEFYARRIRRLLPLSAFVLLVTLAAGWVALPPLARVGLVDDVRAAALYVANWRFAAQATAYSDAAVTDSLVLHYWSLAVEEQYYVLWPLIIIAVLAVQRRRAKPVVPALIVSLSLLVAASFAASVWWTPRVGPQAYYATHTRLWEMGAGALLALVIPRLRPWRPPVATAASVAGLAAIVGSAMVFDAATSFPGWRAAVPVVGTLLLIQAGPETPVARLLSRRPAVAVGRWSYAWYLWHWPLLGLAALVLGDGEGTAMPVTVGAVVLSLALAAASHRLVENPVRYAPRLRDRVGPNLQLGGALTLAPVAVASLFLLGNTGDEPATLEVDGAQIVAMTPEQASQEHIRLGPQCHADQADSTPEWEGCAFGAVEGDRTLLLTGDSHARHWLPALDAWGSDAGWRVLAVTKSACSPMETATYSSAFEREYRECAQWRQEVVEGLKEREGRVDLVVIGRSISHLSLVSNGDERIEDLAERERIWQQAAATTFERFSEVSDRVVVLRDTPWAEEEIPVCISRTFPNTGPSCDIPLPGAAGEDREMFEAEQRAAPSNVAFLETTPLVCADDPCPMITEDGVIVYRDRHHLTEEFSRSLAPVVGQALMDAASS